MRRAPFPSAGGPVARLLLAAVLASATATTARAQLPIARLDGLSPPGGQRGSTLEVRLRGADLHDVTKLHFSHAGIRAEPVPYSGYTLPEETRHEPGRFRVTIDADVPVGVHDAWVEGRYGVSNPRGFAVGAHPSVAETEPNHELESAQPVDVPVTVEGEIGGNGDVDRYVIDVKPGERLVVDCAARSIDSRLEAVLTLTDLETGRDLAQRSQRGQRDVTLRHLARRDGKLVISITDALYQGGAEFPYRLTLSRRPHVAFAVPSQLAPGVATTVRFYGHALRGGRPAESLQGTAPGLEVVESVVHAPAQTTPDVTSRVATAGLFVAGFDHRLESDRGPSNPVFFRLDASLAPDEGARAALEAEPNDTPAQAQEIGDATEVVGHFRAEADRDWYRFTVPAAGKYRLELYASRLGNPGDATLLLEELTRQEDGTEKSREIAYVDDASPHPSSASLPVRSTDPVVTFDAREDASGTSYRVRVASVSSLAAQSLDNEYRLTLHPERADFRLAACPLYLPADNRKPADRPWSVFLRRGAAEVIEVLVDRRGGFDGEVAIEVDQLPEGVTASRAVAAPKQDRVCLVLRAQQDAAPIVQPLRILGRGRPGGEPTVRVATIGTLVWPADGRRGGPRARATTTLSLATTDAESVPFAVDVSSADDTIRVARGAQLELPLRWSRTEQTKNDIQLAAEDVPGNVNIKLPKPKGTEGEAKLGIEVQGGARAGVYTFYLSGRAQVEFRRAPEAVARAEARKKKLEEHIASLEASQKQEAAKTEAEKGDGKALEALESSLAQAREELQRASREIEARKNDAKPQKSDVRLAFAPLTLQITELPLRWTVPSPPPEVVAGDRLPLAIELDRNPGFDEGVEVQAALVDSKKKTEPAQVEAKPGASHVTLELPIAADTTPGDREVEIELVARVGKEERRESRRVAVNVLAPPEKIPADEVPPETSELPENATENRSSDNEPEEP